MRRIVIAIGCAVAFVAAGFAVAAPASATGTATPANINAACSNNTLTSSATSVSGYAGDTFTVTSTAGTVEIMRIGTSVVNWTGNANQQIASGSAVTVTVGSSTGTFYIDAPNPCNAQTISVSVTVTPGPNPNPNPNPGPSDSGSASQQPVLDTLSLAVEAGGASCTGGNPTGYSGAWLALPSADQCAQSGPTVKAGAKLLGWATTPNFPVSIAQHQVDMGWGAYDGPVGDMRMIFIPAGGSVFVSGSNSLFPIWSV